MADAGVGPGDDPTLPHPSGILEPTYPVPVISLPHPSCPHVCFCVRVCVCASVLLGPFEGSGLGGLSRLVCVVLLVGCEYEYIPRHNPPCLHHPPFLTSLT
jgi:hypothetical protein